jgi:hypothetical protein
MEREIERESEREREREREIARERERDKERERERERERSKHRHYYFCPRRRFCCRHNTVRVNGTQLPNIHARWSPSFPSLALPSLPHYD